MLLGEAVAAEQLHTVQADLHALVGGELAGQRGLADEGQALLGARGAAEGDQPQAVELDRDVGAHEGNGLAAGDGLAERLTLLHVGDDVVEHGLAGADRERRPTQPGEGDGLGVGSERRVAAFFFAEDVGGGNRDIVEVQPAQCRAADAHARVLLDGDALGAGLDDEQRRAAVVVGGHDEQLGLRGGRDQRLGAVEAESAGGAGGRGLEAERIEEGLRLGDHDRGLRHVLARELLEVGGLLVGTAPVGQRAGHTRGSQDRQGQAHVTVRKRLGDK
ncbi:Uncharacterised protein [Mycobacteroides abscessus]|nr:Uncharacterised protein [Mycobacteroides abscessus]